MMSSWTGSVLSAWRRTVAGAWMPTPTLRTRRAAGPVAGGVDRLAAHDVRLGDGLTFAASPATPHRHWQTLIDALSAAR